MRDLLPLGTAVAFQGEAYTIAGRRRSGDVVDYLIQPIGGGRILTVDSRTVSEVGTADAENTAVDEGWVPAIPAFPRD